LATRRHAPAGKRRTGKRPRSSERGRIELACSPRGRQVDGAVRGLRLVLFARLDLTDVATTSQQEEKGRWRQPLLWEWVLFMFIFLSLKSTRESKDERELRRNTSARTTGGLPASRRRQRRDSRTAVHETTHESRRPASVPPGVAEEPRRVTARPRAGRALSCARFRLRAGVVLRGARARGARARGGGADPVPRNRRFGRRGKPPCNLRVRGSAPPRAGAVADAAA
jgi:hypothetical protein